MDWNSILISGISIIVGGVVGFVVNHLGGFSKEYFDERKRVSNHRREVARKIIDICTFDIDKLSAGLPTLEQINIFNRTVADLTALDMELGKMLKNYVNYIKDGGLLLIASGGIMDLYRVDLMAWANDVRVGKVK